MGAVAWAKPMPQATATHFCQLLVQTNEGQLKSINAFANGDAQLFAEYAFQHDGWRDLRIFPHGGQWYAATDELPTNLDAEHQRYIQEVFPRMIQEAEAGRWQVVDQYIDRMLEYQRTFSATTPVRQSRTTTIPLLIGTLFILFFATSIIGTAISRSSWGRHQAHHLPT